MIRSRPALAWRSLVEHRRAHLAVGVAAATAAAVITGALLVGDSVRGSLEDRVRERLGGIDLALAGERFFRAALAADLARDAAALLPAASRVEVVPAIILRGSVVHAESRERASEVNVIGVGGGFFALWAARGEAIEGSLDGRTAWANAWLAAEIEGRAGDTILVYAQAAAEIPAEHAFGRKDAAVRAARLELARILPDAGAGLFDLEHSQATPRNVFVPLASLERSLGKEGLANALLVSVEGGEERAELPRSEDLTARFDAALARVATLADLGLRMELRGDHALLESAELLLPDAALEAAREAARRAGAESLEVLTYLASAIRAAGREIPYSTVAAVGSWRGPGAAGGDLAPAPLAPAPSPAPASSPAPPALPGAAGEALARPGGIVLNSWAAEDLGGPAPGAAVRLIYEAVAGGHDLREEEAAFELRGVVPLSGAAADPGWTPPYPGITDRTTLREWDPPFPIDRERIRDQDEAYWEAHRAAPKAFIALEDGHRLWSSRFGRATSVRVRPSVAGDSLEAAAARFEAEFRRALSPRETGLGFRAVKAEGLEAARSGTDFAQLFVGFSFFLIASALALLSIAFRLGLEARSREFGILSAVGFEPRAVGRLVLSESAVVIALGALLGAGGGFGYAGLLIAGLRGLWKEAVNAPFLSLHAAPGSVAAGVAVTVLLALGTVWLTARRLARAPAVRLLSGARGAAIAPPLAGRRRRSWLARGGAAAAGGAALVALGVGEAVPLEAAFFGGGALLLAALLLAVAGRIRASGEARALRLSRRGGVLALARLGARNGVRAPSRSALTVALLACATFLVVAVASSGRDPSAEAPRRDSGNGGFALVGRASVPLLEPLSSAKGRADLGLGEETARLLERARVFGFRLRPGDDASCLNLYRPQSPRLLGAPRDFLERGGFAWASSLAATEGEAENPWLLLEKDLPGGVIPVVGDQSTVKWILHAELGGDVTLADDEGRTATFRIVGLLSHSIFQGELVTSERHFEARFPRLAGRSVFLFELEGADRGPVLGPAAPALAPAAVPEPQALARALEADLADHGLDVASSGDLLLGYQAVENTYLLTFQVLGGLGVLLGTLGLGAILYRNTTERRGELALLRAVGFPRRALAWMVLSETVFLLVLGIAVGTAAALASALPLKGIAAGVPWTGILAMLGAILGAGLLSALLALRAAVRAPLLPALRAE
jgi:ABC-type lipoprotein release transport system permease subunit